MKKILSVFIVSILSAFFSCSYAGGGTTHMFIAQEAIAKLPDAKLRNLLIDNLDAYLVGAYYPDSGYVNGNTYGEDSHWDPFIFTFADYLKEKYTDPATQNPKLVAFLFGCAAHRMSDEIIHWTFYTASSKQDFSGDWDKAHTYGDPGIDLLLKMEKSSSLNRPATWWVPLSDLLQVYHRMGKDQYTAKEIEWGNSVIFFAGYGEDLIYIPAYPYLRWKMPWTANHYYDWPEGGIAMDVQKVAEYQANLWNRLTNQSTTAALAAIKPDTSRMILSDSESSFARFAREALENGLVSITTKYNEDGSVELQPPVINEAEKLKTLVKNLLSRIFS
jgi:hypothetical protein